MLPFGARPPARPGAPRRLVFVVLMLLLASSPGGARGAAGTPIDGAKFEDWSISCEQVEGGAQAEQCFIVQQRILKEGGGTVLMIHAGYPGSGEELFAQFTLPLGILLPLGMELQIDKLDVKRFPIQTCGPNGCKTMVKMDEPLLDALKTGAEAKVTFYDIARTPVTIPISLNGFTAALRALK
jgi:invasion protein IalB